MDIKIEKKERTSWKKWMILILFLFLLLFTMFLLWGGRGVEEIEEKSLVEDKTTEEEVKKTVSNEDIFAGLEDKSALPVDEWNSMSGSENYKISQIRFGGNIALADSHKKDFGLELFDIKSEMVESRENEEPIFLLTWKTNKAAVSEVLYAKDDGNNPQSFKESSYGFEHSALLDDVELSTIYVYRIIARDRWGNEKMSDYFSMYTGEKKESIFDLIISSIEDTFSWAMKK